MAEETCFVYRRGGPGKDYPCVQSSTQECALWECQIANCCQHSTAFPGNFKAGRRALESEAGKP